MPVVVVVTVVVEPDFGVALGVSVTVTGPTGFVDDGLITVVVVLLKLVGSVISLISTWKPRCVLRDTGPLSTSKFHFNKVGSQLTRTISSIEVPTTVVHEVGDVVVVGIRPPVVPDAAGALGQALLRVLGAADARGVFVVAGRLPVAAGTQVDGELAGWEADAGHVGGFDVVLGGG